MRRLTFALLIVIGFAPALLADVAEFLGKPIASVTLIREGHETIDPTLVQLVETHVGDPLSMGTVRESIAHLFSLGLFEDVRVDALLESGRVALRYDLVPIHPVTHIRFAGDTGGPGVDTGHLRRALTDHFGVTPASGRTSEMVQVVTDALEERGYRSARVTATVQVEHDPERATLTLTLAPGVRTTLGPVQIVGTPSLPRDEFLRRLGLTVGTPFERDVLTTRIDRYIDDRRRNGYYEAKITPTVTFDADGRTAIMTLTVDPGPHVRVVFAGDPLPNDVRADLVPVEREGSVDEDLLEDSTSRIEDYLRNLGYRDGKAPHTRALAGGELVITFTITRGPQYRVASVEIVGNAAIAPSEFEPALRTRVAQPFSDARLDADASAIEGLYRQRGYAGAKVRPTATPETASAGSVPVGVRLDIVEGVQTFVDAVSFDGAHSIPDAELRARLGLQVGSAYVPAQLAVDRDAITAMYADRGYENATVSPAPEFSADNTRVRIAYFVREGPQIFVDHILIAGNVRTDASAIARELQIAPGDPLSLAKVNDAQRRLLGLGLFRRARIDELRHGDETRRDLRVFVEESPPTTVSYGFGAEGRLLQVSQEEEGGTSAPRLQVAPRTFAQYTRRNLFGKAQSISLFGSLSVPLNQTTASGGLPEYQAIGTYREPRLFDTPTDGLLNLTFEQQIRSSFTFRRELFTAQAARRITKAVSVNAAYVLQRTELLVVNVNSDSDIELIHRLFSEEPLRLSGFTGTLIRDTRNDQANPSAGLFLSATGQVDAVALGSEVGFIKSFFRAQTFHLLPGTNGVVFAANVSLGLGSEFNIDVPIPEPERFFAGGDTTNRGFALDTLGVRHQVPDPNRDTIDPNGFPIGGNASVIMNGELRVPVAGGLSVVGFTDIGQVFQRASQVNLGDLRSAVGFGVRYQSPFGPLRIDLGFKTKVNTFLCGTEGPQLCPETRPAIHISFGQAF
jgi:outer membrane protein assembly complex protein YaeT